MNIFANQENGEKIPTFGILPHNNSPVVDLRLSYQWARIVGGALLHLDTDDAWDGDDLAVETARSYARLLLRDLSDLTAGNAVSEFFTYGRQITTDFVVNAQALFEDVLPSQLSYQFTTNFDADLIVHVATAFQINSGEAQVTVALNGVNNNVIITRDDVASPYDVGFQCVFRGVLAGTHTLNLRARANNGLAGYRYKARQTTTYFVQAIQI